MSVASRASSETELALAARGAAVAARGEKPHRTAAPRKIAIVFSEDVIQLLGSSDSN